MLVTSVVLRPKSRTLAAAVSETASALEAYSLGAIFAIIADDPGTSSDYLDAFVGKRMVEAASAADAVNAGQVRNAAIVEEISAAVATHGASIVAGGGGGGTPRQRMTDTTMVNSDGTPRQANVAGTMLNL